MALRAENFTRVELGSHPDLMASMHRLRARVFRDRLEWDVAVAGDMEIDVYDAEDATYLLIVSRDASGTDEVVGHVRLLATTGPNMLANTFPFLVDGPVPRAPDIIESSRFCVDTSRVAELAGPGLRHATLFLFAAILEWGLAAGMSQLATVTDARMERILRRTGWPVERLGPVTEIGQTQALAGLLAIDKVTLARIREAGNLPVPVLPSTASGWRDRRPHLARIAA